MAIPTSSPAWYAVYCRPHREAQAAAGLERQLGLQVYLPLVRRQGKAPAAPAPFFPRYLFVEADLTATALSKIKALPGVVRLLSFGGRPTPVPAAVITALRARVEQIAREGGLPRHSFHAGDAVRLKAGPLRGLDALFVAPLPAGERVRVLLEFLGRLTEVAVDVDALDGVAARPPARPARRSRGRGRPIRPWQPAA